VNVEGPVSSFESDRREFTRVRVSIPVRYKFIAQELDHEDLERVWEGSTSNLSGSGLLLQIKVPNLEWVPLMLTGKMKVGVNLILPTYELPVKALCRVSWMESMDPDTQKMCIGLSFREIGKDAQDEIVRYIIKTQMPG
jgi:c-di-GMP-binding flagellar brake protein YcgR